jgi:hypothetical protein
MSHKQIVLSSDPEAIMVQSAEMETERTLLSVAMEGLDNPTSLHIPELDSLIPPPDTSNVPSDEKVTDLTTSVCPERTAFDCL